MKQKMSFVGRKIANGKIEVTDAKNNMIPTGQKVLVCKPTTHDIVHYSTGKIIGKKEIVVGTGTIKNEMGKVEVVYKPRGSKKKAHISSIKPIGIVGPKRAKGVLGRKKQADDYIIKIIEE